MMFTHASTNQTLIAQHFGPSFDPNRYCQQFTTDTVEAFKTKLTATDSSVRAYDKLSELAARNTIPASLKVGIKLSLPQGTPNLVALETQFTQLTNEYEQAITKLVLQARMAQRDHDIQTSSVEAHMLAAKVELQKIWRQTKVVAESLLDTICQPTLDLVQQQLNVLQLEHALKREQERVKLQTKAAAMQLEKETAISNPPESTATYINKQIKSGIAQALSSLQQPSSKPQIEGQNRGNNKKKSNQPPKERKDKKTTQATQPTQPPKERKEKKTSQPPKGGKETTATPTRTDSSRNLAKDSANSGTDAMTLEEKKI
jgi:hypothetical protein